MLLCYEISSLLLFLLEPPERRTQSLGRDHSCILIPRQTCILNIIRSGRRSHSKPSEAILLRPITPLTTSPTLSSLLLLPTLLCPPSRGIRRPPIPQHLRPLLPIHRAHGLRLAPPHAQRTPRNHRPPLALIGRILRRLAALVVDKGAVAHVRAHERLDLAKRLEEVADLELGHVVLDARDEE